MSAFENAREGGSFVLGESAPEDKGLIILSLEGNHIGSDGAIAVGAFLCEHAEGSRNLRLVNMNRCAVAEEGFEAVKRSLVQRASLAARSNLTHVKVTLEDNLIDV